MRAYHIVPFDLSTIHLHLLFRSPVDLPIFYFSSREIDESISIVDFRSISISDFFPPN